MTLRAFRPLALVLAAAVASACSSQKSDADARVAELEKQLADSQKQLADAKDPAQSSPSQSTTAQPSAAPASPGGTPAARPRPAGPPRPTSPPESQKYLTSEEAAKTQQETQRQLEQQQAINTQQSEANARLQEQVEALKPREYTLPAGTVIAVRTSSELSTDKLSNGSTFDAILDRDVKSGEDVIAKARTRVTGVVVESDPGGRVKGVASLTVGIRSLLSVQNNVISIRTDTHSVDAESTKKKDAVRTGVTTGIGAVIGGIAGGGKGAAIGAGAGAATGVGVNAATRGAAAVIPAEELIQFKLTAPVTVVLQPDPGR
jgi:hypothetical protein